ncbi:MAG: FKBP-type peptidyl-prolyl cis-trans isomerase [Acidobacteria bacterium]|nr:FKBP-type peptidyl-prolyl cis-trans isomerase [Acidobacteriota bacterium]
MCLVVALAVCLLAFDGFARASESQGLIETAKDVPALESQKERLSYALGVDLGKRLRNQSVEVDLDVLIQGLKDALSGSKALLTEKAVRAAVNELQNELRRRQIAEKPLKNEKEGEAFLAENKAKEGVVTLESGLQYTILKAGDGNKPTIDDTVVCHYRGTFIDGTEFASSYKNNRPASFAVKRVIKGWSEALQLMPVGSKWQLFIPPNLAYGERGAGRGIGPNATLMVAVELISIKGTAGDNARASEERDSIKADVTGITVSFKLDPRLTQGLYMGERWVSPPTYTTTLDTVDARAEGVDAKGKRVNIRPQWIPVDPEMVTVTPSEGSEAKITVHRAGESSLQVTYQGVSKELAIKVAAYRGDAFQVEIAQKK